MCLLPKLDSHQNEYYIHLTSAEVRLSGFPSQQKVGLGKLTPCFKEFALVQPKPELKSSYHWLDINKIHSNLSLKNYYVCQAMVKMCQEYVAARNPQQS